MEILEPFEPRHEVHFIDTLEYDTQSPDIFSLIRNDHLNTQERQALKTIIKSYPKVLHKPRDNLTFSNQGKYEIKTKDEIPVFTKTYRYPYIHKEEVKRQIDQMLNDNVLRPSNFPWSSLVSIVPKRADASGKKMANGNIL